MTDKPTYACHRATCVLGGCPRHPRHFDAAPGIPRMDLMGSEGCAWVTSATEDCAVDWDEDGGDP